jgi:tetratricopeptide (TPR) repeat protein
MNIKLTYIIILIFTFSILKSQTVKELYQKQNFKELIKFVDKTDELDKDELYCIGYAFFQLENDKKAIEMYDKAIAKGLDDDNIYLYKGLSLRYDKQYEKAIDNFKIAVSRNSKRQKNYTELANTFYYQEKYDSALVYFYKARELDFELGDPYFKIPYIFHIQENFEKALEEYKISASLINKNDPQYIELLKSIGQLEYTVFKKYDNAIKAYSEMISLNLKNYDLYPKLIKAYYANENFAKGDSLFKILKVEYDKGTLSEQFQKYGSVSIGEFEWNGQKLAIYHNFKEPTETLDIMYKVYLLSKDGKSIERTFMTEKTVQIEEDGAKHLLCEREKSGVHHTYPYGWSTDEIDYVSLKKSVILVLDKEMKPSASSNFRVKSEKKKKKK